MAANTQLLDRFGRPMRREELTREIAAPTFGGVRSPITGYPGDGLTPARLASILREADAGDPVRYLELAETIEERDPHYLGVLGTRKRAVSQIAVRVEAASDAPDDKKMAERIEDWLKRDTLQSEMFDILDAVGKGFSFAEIVWDTSSGQWVPEAIEWRDPRWFRFERKGLTLPMRLDDNGQEVPLEGGKFIFANMQAKSGLPLRSGLARVALWMWLFKAYTQRDWAIFTQTYGQPLRVGKFGPGASKEDRDTLFRAVANIAGDCAAIIPESMMIEFIETSNLGSSTGHYKDRCEWLDRQISKMVLGQTSTTDAEVGGLGSGKEHREVQKDIAEADAKALQAVLNRDLIMPWVQLERGGPQARYPRLIIEEVEPEDLSELALALTPFIDRGLRVESSQILEKFGLEAPAKNAEILQPVVKTPLQAPGASETGRAKPRERAVKHPLKGQVDDLRPDAHARQERASPGLSAPHDILADNLAEEADPPVRRVIGQIEAMLDVATSLEEFRAMLLEAFPNIETGELGGVLAQAMMAAHLGGRAAIEEEAGD